MLTPSTTNRMSHTVIVPAPVPPDQQVENPAPAPVPPEAEESLHAWLLRGRRIAEKKLAARLSDMKTRHDTALDDIQRRCHEDRVAAIEQRREDQIASTIEQCLMVPPFAPPIDDHTENKRKHTVNTDKNDKKKKKEKKENKQKEEKKQKKETPHDHLDVRDQTFF